MLPGRLVNFNARRNSLQCLFFQNSFPINKKHSLIAQLPHYKPHTLSFRIFFKALCRQLKSRTNSHITWDTQRTWWFEILMILLWYRNHKTSIINYINHNKSKDVSRAGVSVCKALNSLSSTRQLQRVLLVICHLTDIHNCTSLHKHFWKSTLPVQRLPAHLASESNSTWHFSTQRDFLV